MPKDPRPLSRAELGEILPSQRAIRAFENLFQVLPDDITELLSSLATTSDGVALAMSTANSNKWLIRDADLRTRNVVHVSKLSDLPRAVSGVITLKDGVSYVITGTVDLRGGRIACGDGNAIVGLSEENCIVKSTGLLSTALITGTRALVLDRIRLESDVVFNLNAAAVPGQVISWRDVSVSGAATIGTIAGYHSFSADHVDFSSSAGLTFDGFFNSVSFSNSQMSGLASTAIITFPSTFTVGRQVRFTRCAIDVPSSGVGVDASLLASMPGESYVYDSTTFTGLGTYLAGVAHTDTKAYFISSRGIENSGFTAEYYMHGNAVPTAISGTGTPVLISGSTVVAATQKFTATTSNRATYDGTVARTCRVCAVASMTAGASDSVAVYVAKNGSVITGSRAVAVMSGSSFYSLTAQTLVQLSDGDYLEIFVENNTAATNITVENLHVTIEAA